MGAINFSIDPQLLELLRLKTGAECFVETGTFEGESLNIAAKLFPECHSVEISPDYHRKAQERFAGAPGISLALAPSPEFLHQHREYFASRATVFWLDAHWCAAKHTGESDGQSPLMRELRALRPLHPQSTILIDDARLYLAPPPAPHRVGEWPDFHEVVKCLLETSRRHRLMVLNDVIFFYPEEAGNCIRDYAVQNGIDYQQQSLLTPELLPHNKALAQEAALYQTLYLRHRANPFPWILNPAAWVARHRRDKIRRLIARRRHPSVA